MARRLVDETGITEAQARELISFLGFNWASLVREARMLKKPLNPLGVAEFSAGLSC
ncbi:hypothetical protein C8D77_11382 [Mesorhizobium loti]|uniref:Uncharacterized protein n=1 Tax=Rhizobium loti TaxID=381 RepID=A0A8E2WA07_RHILI|nr:hypothetical protein C8D77_11382 [Mesorhizobium loti]